MRSRAEALATDELAQEAARAELAQSKRAVAAVAAGFFSAAGRHPGVLLAPLTLLVAGVGAGGRAFDGRLRQPGLGVKRPRGLLPGQSATHAALVAVPTTVAALSVALAYDRVRTLTAVAKVGARAAHDTGAHERARLLERVSEVGPAALGESRFVHPFLHVAGPSEGGLLAPADFTAPVDISVEVAARNAKNGRLLEAPWARERATTKLGSGQALCAVDARGVFAALSYRVLDEGIEIGELELTAALAGAPVRRGEPRLRPGARLPTPAPLAIRLDEGLAPVEVLAAREPGARRVLGIVRTTGRFVEARSV